MTSRPRRAAVARLVERLEPGARLLRVRALKGGITAVTHRVDFETRSGAEGAVVLRSFVGDTQESVGREWGVLEYVRQLPFATPEPLLLDGDGSLLGAPTIVMSLVPGRTWLPNRRGLGQWVDQLAETMAAMHDAPLPREGAPANSWVSVWKLEEPHPVFDGNRLAAEIWPLMVELRDVYESTATAFCHIDFWPGNALFSRGRLTGVVDWSWPGFEPFAYDVAYTAFDLVLQLGAESHAASRFVRTYEAATGRRVEHLEAWALPVATRAVTEVDQWAAVYRELGRSECSDEVVSKRLEEFVAEALRKLG